MTNVRPADAPTNTSSKATKPKVSIWNKIFGMKRSKIQVQNNAIDLPPADVLAYAMDMLPYAICVIDKKCNILFTNTAFKTHITEDAVGIEKFTGFLEEAAVSSLLDQLNKLEDSASPSHQTVELPFSPEFNRLQRKTQSATIEWELNGCKSRDIVVLKGQLSSTQGSPIRLMKAKQENFAKEALIKYQAAHDRLEVQRLLIRCVNHEIRTPLNVIMNGINLLESLQLTTSSIDQTMSDTITELRLSCVAASDIMEDLRFYQDITSRHLELNKTSVSLSCLVRDCVDETADLARILDVTLEFSTNVETVLVSVDVPLFSHALLNLLSNALRFTPAKGQVIVRVFIHSDKYVRIEVADTGPGIAKCKQATLFADILHFTPTVNNTEQGYGVGFYVAHGIVTSHNGTVGVRSDGVGSGSTYYFELKIDDHNGKESSDAYIPIKLLNQMSETEPVLTQLKRKNAISFRSMSIVPDAVDFMPLASVMDTSMSQATPRCVIKAPLIAQQQVTQSPSLSIPKLLRILVVDDVPSCRKMLNRLLVSQSCICDEAKDGEEALNMVIKSIESNEPYHGVFMDSSMPIMTGPDASSAMRSAGYTLTIFGVTGNALDADVKDFLSKGADRVYVKPLRMKDITEMLEAVRCCL